MKKTVLRLPKLKTRDELLRTAPELGRFLAAGEDWGSSNAPSTGTSRTRSLAKTRSPGVKSIGRRISDDEVTEEERLRAELERVKSERTALLESLAKLRNDAGKSGGELQQEDIRLLRREMETKKDRLNELRRATQALEETMEQLETTSRDCEQLMPSAEEGLQTQVAVLSAELAGVEQDILEAEAKHELYKLLEIRTRRDHAASEQRMRDMRALQEGAGNDFTTLSKQMHEMRAAKEDAERELGGVVAMYDQVRGDWGKKLKDRRKEVRDLEKRKAEEDQRKQQQAALAAEKARIEHEKTAKTKSERDAAHARLSTVVPQLEALEATWARLHGICGANTAEELITYWQDLRAKEANMRELVRLAEVREARAKEEMSALLTERAEVFETDTARGDRRQQEQAVPQEGQTAGSAEQDGLEGQEAEQGQPEHGMPAEQVQPEEQKSEGTAQGDSSLASSDRNAASDGGDDAGSASAAEAQAVREPQGQAAAPEASPEAALEQLLREKQLAIAEARRRKAVAKEKFGKLSQVCVAANQGLHLLAQRLKAAMEPSANAEAVRRRTTAAGGGSRRVTSLHRRTTTQHPVRRISAQALMEHRSSFQFLPAPEAASPRAPTGASVHDKDFFPDLPPMLADVSGRLGRLLSLVEQLEVASAAAAEAEAAAAERKAAAAAAGIQDEGSTLSSNATSFAVTEASEAGVGSMHIPSKKLQWADRQPSDRQATPRLDGGPSTGNGSQDGEQEAEEQATDAAAEGEKSLRKGFRRRTWAGPAWLDAVRAGKPLTASLARKQPVGSHGGLVSSGAGTSAVLQRIVGYVEDPDSSGDEGAAGSSSNPFDLGSSEDDVEDEGRMVVDRQYLKHRATKLTNPKNRGKHNGQASAGGSPAGHADMP